MPIHICSRAQLESPDQVANPCPQRVGNAKQVHDGNVADAALNAADVSPVEISRLGKLFLRHSHLESAALDFLPQRLPGIGDFRYHIPDVFRSGNAST